MVRTSSRFASCVLAASLLSGCHITVQSGNQPTQAQPPPPPPPARTTTPPATTPPRVTPPRPGQRRRPTPSIAPRVSSPIAFGNGKSGAFQGIAFVIPEGTQQLPKLDGLIPFATLYTDRFDIKSQEFSTGFPGALLQNEWFAIRYEGEFTVPTAGNWQLRVISDDGAILYVDDRRVVVNDGVHTAKAAEGTTQLAAGPHWLRLDYFQASRGPVALEVLVGQSGKWSPLVGTPR